MTDLPILDIDRQAFVLVQLVAGRCETTPAIILGQSKQARIVELRRQVAWLQRELLALGNSQIGRALGGMDHSSIRHLLAQADTRYASDPLYANELDALKELGQAALIGGTREILSEDAPIEVCTPLGVAKGILKAPRGEIHISGLELRVLAEAYLDLLLEQVEAV